MKRWTKRDDASCVADVVRRNTGIDCATFLSPPGDYNIVNLQSAADMIHAAIKTDITLTIYGDYDADGITASSILYLLFSSLRNGDASKIEVILPRRFSEGYGISMDRLDQINSGLLITVDNGISAINEIQAAKDKGLQVIVLDHHIPREDGVLPCADIIVDPHAIAGGNFVDYCGAGLAYKLAQLLTDDADLLDRLVGLAAIGTVADVMPLVWDNRNIVIRGLSTINAGKNCAGLNVLLENLGLYHIDETDIGFKIGPIINASGRMYDDGARRVFDVLTGAKGYAQANANSLIDTNNLRKETVESCMELCENIIRDDCLFGDNPLVVYTTKEDAKQFHEGVVGIIAGRLAEKHHATAIVLCETEDGILKGSGRSYGTTNLKDLLDSVSEHLHKYGGHAGAAGLSVKKEKIGDLIDALQSSALATDADMSASDEILYDLEVYPDEFPRVLSDLQKFAPFGEGNPSPIVKVASVRLSPKAGKFYGKMGKDGQHLKLFCPQFEAVGFDMAEQYMAIGEPTMVNMVGSISINHHGGSAVPQLELLDFEKARDGRANTALAVSLAAKMKLSGLK